MGEMEEEQEGGGEEMGELEKRAKRKFNFSMDTGTRLTLVDSGAKPTIMDPGIGLSVDLEPPIDHGTRLTCP